MTQCLNITREIRELALKLSGETEESTKTLIEIWQSRNQKSPDEYPTARELSILRSELRETPEEKAPLSEAFNNTITTVVEQQEVDRVFDPTTRRDRVTLIARFFTNEVDKAMDEYSQALKDKIDGVVDPLTKMELEQERDSLSRFEIIRKYTPGGIFNRIRSFFQDYVDKSEEDRIQEELDAMADWDEFTDEEKLESAKRKAAYKYQEFQKVLDYFKPLAEEASTILVATEGIRVDPNYVAPKDANLNEDDPEGNSEGDDNADNSFAKEESYKDGWMNNVRQVSSYESLSQAVRKVIRTVPKLDYEGYFEEDDLGFTRYLDADYVHAVFLDKLRNMITSTDMIPLIQQLETNKPWVAQVRELLEKDETLFSQFYQDFRKDFLPYWIQKRRMAPDGTFKIETIALNKPEGVYYLLDAWRDNYEAGSQLDKDSVYDKNGEINKANADKGLAIVEALNNKFANLDTEGRLKLLEDEAVWNDLMKALHMVGIDANPSVLRNALTDIKTAPGITFTDPIMLLLPQLNVIFSGIKKGEVKSENRVDGTVKRGDLINTFGSAYNSIALMMANVTEDAIESSVRENDKSHYSHVTPSYLGKLIKNLKNVMQDKERFERFMQEEFKQYEWFFKDGHWRSDWIEKLATDEKYREALNHKVLLNFDKIEYQDWDSLDYTMVLLNEFWSEDPKSGMAWYHVPILSDAQSAEFIRFARYRDGSELDEEGRKRTYQDIILDHMVDLVNQEWDRINLVIARDEAYRAGDPNIQPIANYDIKRGKNGEIKDAGGSQFKFLPALNNKSYENGETFLDRLNRLKKGSGAELRNFIRETLSDIMDEQFELFYKDMARIGLLDELPNGKYQYIPFAGQSQYNATTAKALNRVKEVLGGAFSTNAEILLRDYLNNNPIEDKKATTIFEQLKGLLQEAAVRGDISLDEAKSLSNKLVVRNNAKEALREYYWNSKHATSQIIQMTTTDLAFYKNMEDFQKRYKEVHAPSLRLNTKATYKGQPIGRDIEKTIYLQDDEILSSSLKDIEEVLQEKVNRGELSKHSMNYILKQFKKVNVADAQAYRSMDSYRAVLGMSGQWTDAMEQAYQHFLDGTWNIEDFSTIWQPKKPYVYTQVNSMSGVEGHTGIKTPVQHKNSEFPLLAMHDIIAGVLGRPSKLRAINKFMQERGIDVIQFESTTKVGKQGVINLNDVNSEEDVLKVLDDATGFSTGNLNPNVVHMVSYEDYGIQTATPEHGIDAEQLVGTQIRKLITADMADDVEIQIGNKKLTKKQWLDLYNEINTENIISKFAEVNEIFKDPKQIEKVLLDEIRGNSRYGQEMVRACTLDENGNFTIPLFDPVQSQRIQTLLNSIIKSRITKQKIKGGALIQVSSYGLSDSLNIVWEGEGKNKHIKYLECYMPAYSRQFYEPLMTKDANGNYYLDVEKLPDDLRKLIGYRVPTEDKYSMAPLYIKGFLPQQNGSAIMLPAEITTLSGSDFDVDKMYIMLPEFTIQKYDIKKAKYYYAREKAALAALGQAVEANQGENANQYLTEAINSISDTDSKLNQWIKESVANGDMYGLRLEKPVIRKVKYDMGKKAKDNSLQARNNMLIDLMWGVLTNPDTASKMVNPGGFDSQKAAARIMTILNSVSEAELTKTLKKYGITIERGRSASSYLFNLPLDADTDDGISLNKLAETLKPAIDPLSPRTQVMFHQQNMTGAKLIGIYANHNANHALMQHTELGVDTENGSFVLNGKRLTSLHSMTNAAKEFISRNNAGFLAASVDNVKDPVLAGLNQNTFTADASMLLSRLGYSPIEIGLLMNQPIVLEITQAYFRGSRSGKSKDAIIDEILAKFKDMAGITADLTYNNYKRNNFLAEDLADAIILAKEMQGIDPRNQADYRKVEWANKQVAVGFLFKRIMNTADALSQVVRATRADTQGGAAGPTIADTIVKIEKVTDLLDEIATNPKFPLTGADVISDLYYDDLEDLDKLREDMMGSPLPFLQAFYTLGIRQTGNMLKPYFPQFTPAFMDVIDRLRDKTKTGKLDVKTMNSIYNDLLAYIMSRNEFFGDGISQNGGTISSEDRRREFINNFPDYFLRVVGANEDIAELEFIKRLRVQKANDRNPVDTIVFKNVGRLSSTLRERYMRDWASLLHSANPVAQQLALNLFRYSYYRNGFAFGPNTFIHLTPVAVRMAVPEYIDTLRGLMESEDDYTEFVEQYVYNHLDNRRLVPEVSDETTVQFVDNNGDIKDEVVFSIDENSSYADKKVVKKRNDDGQGNVSYEFFEYISKRIRGGYAYYKLNPDIVTEDNVAVYERIAPLGYKSSFIEYEYGKNVEELTSVIKKNDLDYDPLEEISARFNLGDNQIDYDSIPDVPEFDPTAYGFDAASAAFQQVYGDALPSTVPSQNDIDTIPPNADYRDAEGQEICGGAIISYTL